MRHIFTTDSREDSASRGDGLVIPTDTMSQKQQPMIAEGYTKTTEVEITVNTSSWV